MSDLLRRGNDGRCIGFSPCVTTKRGARHHRTEEHARELRGSGYHVDERSLHVAAGRALRDRETMSSAAFAVSDAREGTVFGIKPEAASCQMCCRTTSAGRGRTSE